MTERKNNLTDYLAVGIINFAGVYFWIQIVNMTSSAGLRIFSYIVYVLTGILSSYLFFRKRGVIDQIQVAKTTIISWLISVLMLASVLQTEGLTFYPILLFCFGLGGFIGSRVVIQEVDSRKDPLNEEEL